ncbi:MAG: hypothetical protein A2486_04435 [Burkholderiales bacterium RIFOXYC12_FULL_65_23]|uniref:DUF7663 domain-containing protein n=1 Tax=Malikia spinosa TaxID=86180 RepID=UPI0008C23380|nr:MAG: hypothetical protein A2486_04435 [Burkholderiales bacterium RIFOXYC12_FULL_65_23]
MSIEFLQSLNGLNRGPFRDWLDRLDHEPRIAWYPSAGEDFRDLMYLHPGFRELSPAAQPEPAAPSIFLHSDYFPWKSSRFLDSRWLYRDHRTHISVKAVEELPRLDLPLDPGIVHFPEGSSATGRVLFMQLEVNSDPLGCFSVPLIYAFVENAALCATRMLPHQARVSHIVHVRSGGGLCGGGYTNGACLLQSLERLQCELFISDGHLQHRSGDDRALALFPNLAGPQASLLDPIRMLPGTSWSHHGDVSWHRCSPAGKT